MNPTDQNCHDESVKEIHHHSKSQKIALILSFACAIHCAALPVLMVLMAIAPTLSFLTWFHWFENEKIEWMFILSMLVIGFYGLFHGYRNHHHNKAPIVFFTIGVSLMILIHLVAGHQLGFLSLSLSLLAAILVVWSQWKNYKLSKNASCHVH